MSIKAVLENQVSHAYIHCVRKLLSSAAWLWKTHIFPKKLPALSISNQASSAAPPCWSKNGHLTVLHASTQPCRSINGHLIARQA